MSTKFGIKIFRILKIFFQEHSKELDIYGNYVLLKIQGEELLKQTTAKRPQPY